ncbi:DUF3347 domain-containing protein [Dysgonomonas sp. HDW5A]|uniref:DUF3347 domain-containing protein n=1 Tax=Dysgonomonas sp. HDW5A TaxID=2714926 RepID=UPI0014077072|nr:DUF3347 domain-containing protein [Dysgonomonas sp. HDW5A]QIK60266.1 DUF3347 domain-containing protein [Dysgonomonas sp. HDW5A]
MKKLILAIAVTLLAIVSYNQPVSAQNKDAGVVLQPVYQSYFALKDALVASDGKAAQSAAESLYKNIAAVPMDKLGSSHTVWMNLQSKLSFDAEHMKGTNDIGHHREHFVSLSKNMYELMKVATYGKTVYYQHCPMYNKKKGGANWLSLDKAIKNPYFGSKMLTCGSTTETLE